ncbi:hypothetical protein HDU76_003319, partial [Blyttiomyces sp. JEL0837]
MIIGEVSVLGMLLSAVSSAMALQYAGVNEAGLEFGMTINGPDPAKFPGTLGQQFFPPSATTMAQWAKAGMNAFRLPFAWERIQPTANGDFNSGYLQTVKDAAQQITFLKVADTQQNATVILDPHNYARFNSIVLDPNGQQKPNGINGSAALADLWTKLAQDPQFKSQPNVIFDLMNEPQGINTAQWLTSAQAAIDAIRATGGTSLSNFCSSLFLFFCLANAAVPLTSKANNLILVPGNCFTGAHSWVSGKCDIGDPNANVMIKITDPMNNFAYDMHQYFDNNFSGTIDECTQDPKAVLSDATNWLKTNNRKAFLGEVGVSNNPNTANCPGTLDTALSFLETNTLPAATTPAPTTPTTPAAQTTPAQPTQPPAQQPPAAGGSPVTVFTTVFVTATVTVPAAATPTGAGFTGNNNGGGNVVANPVTVFTTVFTTSTITVPAAAPTDAANNNGGGNVVAAPPPAANAQTFTATLDFDTCFPGSLNQIPGITHQFAIEDLAIPEPGDNFVVTAKFVDTNGNPVNFQ